MSVHKKKFVDRWVFSFLLFILFVAMYAAYYYMSKDKLFLELSTAFPYGSSMSNIKQFLLFGGLLGIIWGLLSLVLKAILSGIKNLFGGRRCTLCNPILSLISYGAWLLMAFQLLYLEPRYTDVGVAIILLAGKPLFYAALLLVVVSVIWFIFSLIFYFTKKDASWK